MYFTSFDEGELPEIEALLREYGIEFEHGSRIVDNTNSIMGYREPGLALITRYVGESPAAKAIHDSIRRLPSLPKTVAYNAKPMKLSKNLFQFEIEPVLMTYPTAKVYNSNTVVREGEEVVMAVAQRSRMVDDAGNSRTTLILACSSTQFTSLDFLNAAYCNREIILNTIGIMTSKKAPVDIKFKIVERNNLDMSIGTANNWTLAVMFLFPVIISVLGMFVWLRRRHS